MHQLATVEKVRSKTNKCEYIEKWWHYIQLLQPLTQYLKLWPHSFCSLWQLLLTIKRLITCCFPCFNPLLHPRFLYLVLCQIHLSLSLALSPISFSPSSTAKFQRLEPKKQAFMLRHKCILSIWFYLTFISFGWHK